MSRIARHVLLALLGSAFSLAVACGASSEHTDEGAALPPSSSSGDESGAPGDGSVAPPGDGSTPPGTCPDAQKRCAVAFEFSGVGAEGQVEIRGDWAASAWSSGVPMTNFGSAWRRTLLLTPGSRVEYKFCLDPKPDGSCASWQADPSKPITGSTSNNVLASVACAETVCAPAPGAAPEPLRFIALGDTGNVGPDAVTAAMDQKCKASGCDFVLLLGDNIYTDGASSPTDPQFQSKFEDRFAAVHAPFYPILGNHDYGGNGTGSEYAKGQNEVDYTAYSKKWRMPARYHRFTAGAVDFFAIDTNAQMYGLDGQQRTDVKAWIAASTARWKIAFGHHPYLSNGPHGNAGTYDGTPSLAVFDGANVKAFAEAVYCGTTDVYLCGHDHSRQWLVPTCSGTELAVSGAGAMATTLPGTNATRFQSIDLGFLYVVIDGKTLTADFVATSGATEFTRVLTKP